MVLEEEDQVERYIWCLPDNIQRNVTSSAPTRLQDAVRMANTRAYTAGNNEKKAYARILPYCNKCKLHYARSCIMKCGNYKKVGHMTRDCKTHAATTNQRSQVANQRADRSFMSTTFSSLIDVVPTALDVSYAIELADGRVIGSDNILRGLLMIRGDRSDGGSNLRLSVISCTKTQKYIQKGFHVFLAHITEKKTEDKSEEKRLEDVSIVWDFTEVFPEDIPRLPKTLKVEFQIDLVPSVAPIE
ncbi:hypothetical protein Tco_0550250 [Tanacetum coccineum]